MPPGYIGLFAFRDADDIKQRVLLIYDIALQRDTVLFSELGQNYLHQLIFIGM